jgi:predicted Zn-dependent protease
LLIGLVMAGLVLTRGCQHGPFDRAQVVGLSPQEEKELGTESYRDVLSKEAENVINRGPVVDAVQGVMRNLARASNAPVFLKVTRVKPNDFQWEVHVIRSSEVNAFCLPGGKIVVYTGILPIARTEQGLAVVMGHEIAHALAHHGAERMAQERLAQIGQMTAGSSIGGLTPSQRIAVMRALGVGAQYGVLLPFSRSHESEADHIGLYLMATAGYDPAEAPRFWERMMAAARGQGAPPEILSTHPSDERRIRDLERWQAEVRPIYEAATRASGANTLLPRP